MKVFILLGRSFLQFVEEVGGVFILLCRSIHLSPRIFRNLRNMLIQMERIGIGSIPLVLSLPCSWARSPPCRPRTSSRASYR